MIDMTVGTGIKRGWNKGIDGPKAVDAPINETMQLRSADITTSDFLVSTKKPEKEEETVQQRVRVGNWTIIRATPSRPHRVFRAVNTFVDDGFAKKMAEDFIQIIEGCANGRTPQPEELVFMEGIQDSTKNPMAKLLGSDLSTEWKLIKAELARRGYYFEGEDVKPPEKIVRTAYDPFSQPPE